MNASSSRVTCPFMVRYRVPGFVHPDNIPRATAVYQASNWIPSTPNCVLFFKLEDLQKQLSLQKIIYYLKIGRHAQIQKKTVWLNRLLPETLPTHMGWVYWIAYFHKYWAVSTNLRNRKSHSIRGKRYTHDGIDHWDTKLEFYLKHKCTNSYEAETVSW